MLNQLRMQNFKSWKDTGEIRLAPLTGLFGVNSSGKSAILQLILLLKQTVESSDLSAVLHLGSSVDAGAYVNFGSMDEMLHHQEEHDTLAIDLSWILLEQVHIPDLSSGPGSAILDIGGASFHASILNYDWEPSNYNESETSMNGHLGPVVESFKYRFHVGDQICELGMREQVRNQYVLVAEGFEGVKSLVYSSPSPIKFYGFPDQVHNYYPGFDLSVFVDAFEKQFRNVYYLGPLRAHPSMSYVVSGEEPTDVGTRGEEFVSALVAAEKNGTPFSEQVSEGLRSLGLANSLFVRPVTEKEEVYEVRICQTSDSKDVRITDVGFGVSQVLPVLTLCYYAPQGSTLILEHPEMHLHPKAQAGLADVFIDAIKSRNIQIILESHSEHLLHRLRRRIAEERFDSDKMALYFIDNPEGSSEILSLDLDEFGNIGNWPPNFFGDDLGDLIEITKATIRRNKDRK